MAKKKLFTLLTIQFLLVGIGSSVVGPLIPILSGVFNVGLDIIGTTLSLNAFGLLLASFFSGVLSERFGKVNIAIISSILFSFSFFILFLSENFIVFTLSYLLFGISWGVITSVTIFSPVFSRASARSSRPCSSSPWKL